MHSIKKTPTENVDDQAFLDELVGERVDQCCHVGGHPDCPEASLAGLEQRSEGVGDAAAAVVVQQNGHEAARQPGVVWQLLFTCSTNGSYFKTAFFVFTEYKML